MQINRTVNNAAICGAAIISIFLAMPIGVLGNRAEDSETITLNNDGVSALGKSDFEVAIKCFEAALSRSPEYDLPHDNLAIAHNRFGLMLQNKPVEALVHFHRALILNDLNPSNQAMVRRMVKLLGRNPDNFKDRIALAEAAHEKEDFIGEAVEYSEALKLHEDPDIRAKHEAVLKKVDKRYAPLHDTDDVTEPPQTVLPADRSPAVPVSSQPIDWAAYISTLKASITRQWSPPQVKESLHIAVTFKVIKNGRVSNILLKISSRNAAANKAALVAVQDAGPFSSLPNAAEVPLEFNFDFNVSQGKWTIFGARELRPLSNQQRQSDESTALDYERRGLLQRAKKLYERILSADESDPKPDLNAISRIKLDLERVRSTERLSSNNDPNHTVMLTLDCLHLLDKLTGLEVSPGIELKKLLTERIDKGSAYAQTTNDLRMAAISPRTKMLFAQSLLHAYKQHPDANKSMMTSLQESADKYQTLVDCSIRAEQLASEACRLEQDKAYGSAEKLYKESQTLRQAHFGNEDPDALLDSAYIARTVAEQGRINEALQIDEQAFKSFKHLKNPGRQYVELLENYGDLLNRAKHTQTAKEIYNEASVYLKKTER